MTPLQAILKELQEDVKTLDKLEHNLRESESRCEGIDLAQLKNEDSIEIEALTSRFERAQDIFVRKILRLIDIASGEEGTIIDVLNRSEKRGIIESAFDFREMRALRNKIAHEYAGYGPSDIARDVMKYVPVLLHAFAKAREFAKRPEFQPAS